MHENVVEVYEDFIQSPNDVDRTYRGFKLKNKLRAVVVSDPTCQLSAGCMNVQVGSMYDPPDIQGLAHFLEHMLFLGTEKYPQENEYSKFVVEHAGSMNAFTSNEHTCYYFTIDPRYLTDALDRFAQFFIAPLFNEERTEREINAVDQEHQKNIMLDSWRLNQLKKSLVSPEHPYNHFGTGNKETLLEQPLQNGINLRQRLLEFYTRYYSSNVMCLCVVGKESLDELTEMVAKIFSEIENKDVPKTPQLSNPFTDDLLRTELHVVPIKDVRELMIVFNIPYMTPYYSSGPDYYVSHLIGHEGPGSLLSELKSRQWIISLVGGSNYGCRGFDFFSINFSLTEEGQDHIYEIVAVFFQYVKLLKQSQPQQWIFDECKQVWEMLFRFKEKGQPEHLAESIAKNMHYFPPEHVLKAYFLLDNYDPTIIEILIDCLVPSKVRLIYQMKDEVLQQNLETEPYYGTQYCVSSIPQNMIRNWENVTLNPALHLPLPNIFIPTNFDLVPRLSVMPPYPRLILDSDYTKLWFKQDDTFFVPKGTIQIEISNPLVTTHPIYQNLMSLFLSCFQDSLQELTYAAQIAALIYHAVTRTNGFLFSIKGYTEKTRDLLRTIVEKLLSFDVTQERFENLKDAYRRGLENGRTLQPYQLAIESMDNLLVEVSWTLDDQLNFIDEISHQMLMTFFKEQLMSRCHIECLIHGNFTEQSAIDICQELESLLTNSFQTKPLLAAEKFLKRAVNLPKDSYHLFRKVNVIRQQQQHLSAIDIFYQTGLQSVRSNIILDLIVQVFHDAMFNELRTQQQLGYIVYMYVKRLCGMQGLDFLVQSARPLSVIDLAIENFVANMPDYLEKMSDKDFLTNVQSLETQILEKPKKLSCESTMHWNEIACRQYYFGRDKDEVEALKLLTKTDLIVFCKEYFLVGSPKRKKLAVHVSPSFNNEDGGDVINGVVTPLPEPTIIKSIPEFKAFLPLYPLVKPQIPTTLHPMANL